MRKSRTSIGILIAPEGKDIRYWGKAKGSPIKEKNRVREKWGQVYV